MNEVLLTNIFFVITGSAVLVVTTFLCYICFHVVKIVKITRAILERVEASTESIAREVESLRERFANGSIFGKIVTAVMSAVAVTKQTRTSLRRKKDINDD